MRFTNEVAAGVGPTWEGIRVLYLQHPSDPIVCWEEVLQPPGLTPDKTERLRDVVTEESG